ncbi:MAG: zinc-ribbon domain-containing protein [Candidatus Xenobiia bacterium LiM19]
MALQCPSCGRENNDDAALCLHCGARDQQRDKKAHPHRQPL